MTKVIIEVNSLKNNDLIGKLVISKAGRDDEESYIVVDIIDGDYILLANGYNKKVDKPKKKKLKHLKPIEWLPGCETKLSQEKLTNRFIREAVNALEIEDRVTE